MGKKEPRIDPPEYKLIFKLCILNEWVEPDTDGDNEWVLTRKGQTIRMILNELYSKGKVARLENPNLYKKSAANNLSELILLLIGRIKKFDN
tara:strand:- start:438 stop:713 length:276 start_codon:yes stop_codon:yes gene_type:complete